MSKLKKIAWHSYMFIYVVLSIGAFAFTIWLLSTGVYDFNIYIILWSLVVIATLFGLNGYITKSKYLKRSFWKIIFILIIINYFYEMYFMLENTFYRDSMISGLIMFFLSENINDKVLIPFEACKYGLYVPMYVAIYMYSFKSDDTIWSKTHNKQLKIDDQKARAS